jgi:hypothetical protein
MPQTIRLHLTSFKGRRVVTMDWGAIERESVVIVTASEYRAKGQPLFVGESDPRFVGAATVRVDNISPRWDGGVAFVVTVDWQEPIPIVVDVTVLDAKPILVQFQNGAVKE